MIPRRTDFCTRAVELSLSWVGGCWHAPTERKQHVPVQQHGANYKVAVLGDTSRNELLANIAMAHDAAVMKSGSSNVADVGQGTRVFHFQSAAEDGIFTQAALAWEADLVILAVDATQGPLPINREHILVSRQMAVPTVAIAFTRSGDIEDPELRVLSASVKNLRGERAAVKDQRQAAAGESCSDSSRGAKRPGR